ncbi:DUF6664 family protein [Caproiciproducens sp. CPB-2]|uniref:DUF6664 family protein n=1 Tax=Caproiciproducens sp. CPB-2 TaxID=3030017 RepID=UPI0023DC997E|nr:hypothetical protein [Caproiciproducens sp. CPB-2]MDF1494565.1 hypothetical protein [Caproiciproducens sp. CPB-2]
MNPKDSFYNLAERIANAFPEIDSDIATDLSQIDGEYADFRKQVDQLQQAHPFIEQILEGAGAITLSAAEHEILLRYLSLTRQLEDMERRQIYFRGHTDNFAYLKKIGAL